MADRLKLSTRLLTLGSFGLLLLILGSLAIDPDFEGNPVTHFLGQLIVGVLGLFLAAMIFRSRLNTSGNALNILALGLLGAGILNLVNGLLLIPSFRPETLAEIVLWGWLPARTLLSVMLCISLLVGRFERQHGATGSAVLLVACGLVGTFVVATSLYGILLPWPMPVIFFPDNFISRPAELFPALFFSLALIGALAKGAWRRSIFEYNLLLFILANVLIQALFMAFSERSYDGFFAAAMTFRIVGYGFLLVGLMLHHRDSMQQESSLERARHQAIVETASDGIITFNGAGIIDTFNPSAQKLFGYSAEEILGKSITLLSPDPQKEKHDDLLLTVRARAPIAGRAGEQEVLGQRKDGSTFPVECAINEVPLKKRTLFTVILRDITERKEKQGKLEELSERLELALESAGLGSWVQDLDNKVLMWDEQMFKLYSRDPAEGPLSPRQWLAVTHSDDRAAGQEAFRVAVEDGTPINHEFRIELPDGALRWLSVDLKMIERDATKPRRIVGICRDVSASKQHLEALELARKQAEEANRAKSAFLATMSHEIRTPLNGVIGLTEVLQQTNLEADQADITALISQSASSLMGIIEDVLDFSKIEAGKLDLDPRPISLAAVVEDACLMLSNLAEKSDVQLSVFVDPEIPAKVWGDDQRLRQVLTNLTNNAIKFSGQQDMPGLVAVRARLAEVLGEQVIIEFQVSDNGIGMDDEAQARLFSPFTQADTSISRRYGGTGLGLTISHRLVALMRGGITLLSQPGQGAVFTIRLPFSLLPEAETSDGSVDINGTSCLVVGGREDLAADLECYLTHAGALVEFAPSLAAAQESYSTSGADPRVWVIDMSTQPSFDTLRTALERHPKAIVISRKKQVQSRLKAAGINTLDGSVLIRKSLLEGVAAFVGNVGRSAIEAQSASGADEAAAFAREQTSRQRPLILVAEDNEVNQQVILHQLTVLGYQADVASNGFEAFNQWRSGDYALLLTDLQMPEMDGFELAEKIRATERPGNHIPIVALTANTLAGEAEKCRLFGMDDYLSKPTSLDDLGRIIRRLKSTTASETSGATADVSVEEIAAIDPPIDLGVLRELVGDNPQIVNDILGEFPAHAATIAAELRDAFDANKPKLVVFAAHKLRSSAHALGATGLSDLCASIERAGHEEDDEVLGKLMDQFETELVAVDHYIANLEST